MPNSLYTNPIYLDTAGGTSALPKRMKLLGVIWVSKDGAEIAVDNDFLLHDSAGGGEIIGKRAKSAGDDLAWSWGPDGFPVNGIYLTDLDGGVCYIYVK